MPPPITSSSLQTKIDADVRSITNLEEKAAALRELYLRTPKGEHVRIAKLASEVRATVGKPATDNTRAWKQEAEEMEIANRQAILKASAAADIQANAKALIDVIATLPQGIGRSQHYQNTQDILLVLEG